MSKAPKRLHPRPRYTLKDLLVGMTPEAMGKAFDWGPDVGREVVEYDPDGRLSTLP